LALRGYDNVQASELARALRMSVGTLYRRYGSKHGFALAVRDFAENTLCIRARGGFECEHGRQGVDFRQAFFSFWWELVSAALEEPGLFAFTFLHWHPHVPGPHARYALAPYFPRSLGPLPSYAPVAHAPATFNSDALEPHVPDAFGPEAREPYAPDDSEPGALDPYAPDAFGPEALDAYAPDDAEPDALDPYAPDVPGADDQGSHSFQSSRLCCWGMLR
jgi:AcrR family transcriptional regulator